MFDDFKRRDDVEGFLGERDRSRRALEEASVGVRIMRQGVTYRFCRNIDAGGKGHAAGKFGCAVACPASDVESLGPAESRGEGVTGYMFGPKIVIHLAGYHPLAGKLDHNATAPAPIREFTSTRQGK